METGAVVASRFYKELTDIQVCIYMYVHVLCICMYSTSQKKVSICSTQFNYRGVAFTVHVPVATGTE